MHSNSTVERLELEVKGMKFNAFAFYPGVEKKPTVALFAHGYTSHKDSILNWASRLADEGITSVVMDIPGHFLGSFGDVEDFQTFKDHSPEIFVAAHQALKGIEEYKKVIIGGHSLGGLLALKASDQEYFKDYEQFLIAVGLGMAPLDRVHVFDSDFFMKTMNLRAQLVSPALHPDNIFPWIKAEKEGLSISKKNVLLLTGLDDVVVGEDGSKRLKEILEKHDNQVALEEPKTMPHHLPERAAAHIWAYLKKNYSF